MNQEEFALTLVNLLTSENSVAFLGRTIKRLKHASITMLFSQEIIDELFFEVAGIVATRGVKLHAIPKIKKFSATKSFTQNSRQPLANFVPNSKSMLCAFSFLRKQGFTQCQGFGAFSLDMRSECQTLSGTLRAHPKDPCG